MKRLMQRQVKRTTLVFLFCLTLLVGIGAARSWHIDVMVWWWLALPGLAWTFRHRTVWTVVWVVMIGLSLGWWRGSLYTAKLAEYNPYYGRKVVITARADNDAAYNRYKQLAFDARDIVLVDSGQKLTGKINVSGYGVPALYAGDTFRAEGKLQSGRGSYQVRMSYAQLEVVRVDHGVINVLRRDFAAGMQSALPEPLGSFGMGLLIGQKINLPDDVYSELLMVGLVHIIAVSGYNLTVILRATNRLLGARSKRLSTLVALLLIGVFLLFAGSSASIVRASVVSVIAIAASYYGRNVKPLVLIMMAAAITGWVSPFYVWTDTGWYLSFLAFTGVMVLGPMVLARMPKRFQGSLLLAMAVETLCAEIMATPFIIHVFGQTSLVGIVANVLVAAFVPIAMLLCLASGLAGMLLPTLAGWIAWPAKIVLTYMLDTAKLLSDIPHVFIENMTMSMTELLLIYAVVALAVFTLWRRLGRPQFMSFENKLSERPGS